MTPAGIEPATFRFVAQHINHCATAALLDIFEEKVVASMAVGCNFFEHCQIVGIRGVICRILLQKCTMCVV